MGQIKKARGQKKWINQPQPEAPPIAEQFCFWIPDSQYAQTTLPARPRAIAELPLPLAHCHVASVEHGGHLFRLYQIGPEARGVFRGAGLPVCESIDKERERSSYLGLLLFNEQGFQRAKLDHHNYWRWRTERNDARWTAQENGQLDYDAKNLMHCMRLLFSARQMLDGGAPLVRVSGAQKTELLDIRAGAYTYPQLIARADALVESCEADLPTSNLPEQVNMHALNLLCLSINDAAV